jgi:hypothetical protein
VRTGIELISVAIGFVMGGQVGIGTLVFASLIGVTLRWMLTASGYVTRPAAEASDCASPGACSSDRRRPSERRRAGRWTLRGDPSGWSRPEGAR